MCGQDNMMQQPLKQLRDATLMRLQDDTALQAGHE